MLLKYVFSNDIVDAYHVPTIVNFYMICQRERRSNLS